MTTCKVQRPKITKKPVMNNFGSKLQSYFNNVLTSIQIKNDNPISYFSVAAISETEFTNLAKKYKQGHECSRKFNQKKPLTRRRLTTYSLEYQTWFPRL